MFKLPSSIAVLAAAVWCLVPAQHALAQGVSLQQCANGGPASPRACTGSAWTTASITRKSGHYVEDDSVPFRLLFGNLSPGGTYSVTIQWDTTEGGLHAYDYLTSYNRTEASGNNPCSGVDGCALTSTFPIPLDPNVSGAGVAQVPGTFALSGGTIVSESAYTYEGTYDGRSSASITITFIATAASPVLAWGSHLASQLDWGLGAASSAIPGASFHVRLYQFDGRNVGSQDRSISKVGEP